MLPKALMSTTGSGHRPRPEASRQARAWTRTLAGALTGVAALLAVTGATGVGSALAATVPNPAVQGPIQGGTHGYPWNHSLFELSGKGYSYTENEYFYSGTATNLAKGVPAPYASRMLVRLPQNPAKFNGTVIVEWLNVTGGNDLETVWPVEGNYLMQHGYGYVGVSAQLVGADFLPAWDSVRYAGITHPGDEFSFDIFSQALQALRDPGENRAVLGGVSGVDPMRGMAVKHLVVSGASQSALKLTEFINGGYNRGEADAYLITRGGGPFTDFSTPIFQQNEETAAAPTQPDGSRFRLWEEAGTAHAPYAWYSYIWSMYQRDLVPSGTPNPINTACAINRGSVDYTGRALARWIAHYFETGSMGPSMPRLLRNGSEVIRDSNGLAEGGVRQPFVEAPVAYNAGTGCALFGTYRGWTPAMIQSLYPTHEAYVAAIKQAASYDVKKGWLLAPDAKGAVAKAEAFSAPWTLGSCYETSNPKGEEKGTVSGQISSVTWSSTFLTLGDTAPLGGFDAATHQANCTVVVNAGL
jgi:alpha/beta hydrolase family protein